MPTSAVCFEIEGSLWVRFCLNKTLHKCLVVKILCVNKICYISFLFQAVAQTYEIVYLFLDELQRSNRLQLKRTAGLQSHNLYTPTARRFDLYKTLVGPSRDSGSWIFLNELAVK